MKRGNKKEKGIRMEVLEKRMETTRAKMREWRRKDEGAKEDEQLWK